MTEDEFDALMRARSFGTKDAIRAEDRLHRGMTLLTTLGRALWGTDESDAQHQLLRSLPEIPAGFDLTDFQELQRIAVLMASESAGTLKALGLSHLAPWSRTIVAGTQKLTLWEARCEIVRRAIDYMEER